jgi:hypothetical protein
LDQSSTCSQGYLRKRKQCNDIRALPAHEHHRNQTAQQLRTHPTTNSWAESQHPAVYIFSRKTNFMLARLERNFLAGMRANVSRIVSTAALRGTSAAALSTLLGYRFPSVHYAGPAEKQNSAACALRFYRPIP